MSSEAHLVELKRRHDDLEQKLAATMARPSSDHLEIVRLKRKKLSLKDKITRLSMHTSTH